MLRSASCRRPAAAGTVAAPIRAAPIQIAAAPRSGASRRRRSLASVVSASREEPPQRPYQKRRAELRDPARLAGSSTATVQVQDRGGALSLDAYMRLPTDQYNELDPSMITALGGSSFLLRVPRVTLFSVWVEPEVVVDVRLAEGGPGVIFEAGECRLIGSDLLQRLQLDKRFVLYFHTQLTWEPNSLTTPSSSNGRNGNGGPPSSNGNSGGSAPAAAAAAAAGLPPGTGRIHAKADVQVWSEVVGPFAAIPRPMLEGTGSAVVGALMQALLPVFMRKLADDYVRWAGDSAYRARRAAASPSAAAAAVGGAPGPQPAAAPPHQRRQ